MSPRLPFALLGLSTLGACALSTTPPVNISPAPTRADSHVIEVSQTSARMEIAVAQGDTTLTDKARTDLTNGDGHATLSPETKGSVRFTSACDRGPAPSASMYPHLGQ